MEQLASTSTASAFSYAHCWRLSHDAAARDATTTQQKFQFFISREDKV